MQNYELFTLANGLRVAVEPIAHARSVAVGIWIGAGANDERRGEAGAAHFLEHMLFKGTLRRNGRELAAWMDRIGGEVNAVTGRETTTYYAWVLAEYWVEALELLAEMLLESRLDPSDVERERQVILEEIKGDDDAAEQRVMADFDQLLWGSHPLGRPITGTRRSVAGLSLQRLVALRQELYTPDNAVVCLVGAVDPGAAREQVARVLGGWQGSRSRPQPGPPVPRSGLRVRRRPIDQVHLVLGGPGPGLGDPALYSGMVLGTILGGGNSSRLFQRIREEEALAYSVYSFQEAYRHTGVMGVYAAVRTEAAARALALIRVELERLAREPVSEEELERARAQLKSSLLLGLESVPERMHRMGEQLTLLGRTVPPEQVVARIEAVTAADVQAMAGRLLAGPQALAAVGPIRRDDLLRA